MTFHRFTARILSLKVPQKLLLYWVTEWLSLVPPQIDFIVKVPNEWFEKIA